MIETVEWNDKTLALILYNDYESAGVNFLTSADNPLQLGVLKHQQGTRIEPHIHRNSPRTVREIQEVLHIAYGKAEVEFYSERGGKIRGIILNPGDTILLLRGGHGINILEDSKIIEVKQGPYYGAQQDKDRLNVKSGDEDEVI